MIRHVVLLNWKDGVSDEQIAQVTAGFEALQIRIPEIVSYSFGQDASIFRGNADYALIASFNTEVDLKAYVAHPDHQRFMQDVTGPIMESFQSIQFIEP